MEWSNHIIEAHFFIVPKATRTQDKGCLNQLSVRSDCIDLVFILVCGDRRDATRYIAHLACRLHVLHKEWNGISHWHEKGSLVAVLSLENVKVVVRADHKAIRVRVDRVDGLSLRRVKDEAFVLSIVGAEEHLAIVCADKDHARHLRPRMAREVC